MPFDLPSYVMGSENGSGGGDIVLKNLTVTENGVTTAPSGQAYKKVTVNVPQPSGSIDITDNGTVDVSAYETAVVNVQKAVPIEVPTSEGMAAVLISANVGKAYKFTGTTDETYTNGDIYVVEESV